MNPHRTVSFTTLLRVAFCVLLSLAQAAQIRAGGQPTVSLSETLFVSEKADLTRDHDLDWLKDDQELKIAELFTPLLIFDSAEEARRPNEPITLFQVRPIGCIGVGCPAAYKVGIRYVYLWQKDGGYGPSSFFCTDSHNGDNQGATLYAESDNGKDWTLTMIANSHFVWPASQTWGDLIGVNEVQWYQNNHPIIQMSAHKHHQYFDTSYDEDASVSSDWNCSEDVNGLGAKVLPSLVSPHADKRASNAGEPELHRARKCLEWQEKTYKGTIEGKRCVKWGPPPPSAQTFVNDLGPYGFPGEQAWSSAPFCGGLECDTDVTTSIAAMWQTDSFSISPTLNWDHNETLGGVKGRLTDKDGKPIPGSRLYYRPVITGLVLIGGKGPWSMLPVDATGHYDARLPFGIYLLRPVASDHSFAAVPKSVESKRGAYTITNFSALSADKASIARMPTLRPQVADKKMSLVKTYVLSASTPNRMVVADAQASDLGKGTIDPFVDLPRRAALRFHVESILDQSGHPAKTLDEAVCSSSYIKLPDGTVTEPCHLGGPVEGAKIQVRLGSGANLVEPLSPNVTELTTDSNGNAYLTLQSGVHPGLTSLEINLTTNPVNPWAVFSYSRQSIELQPGLHGDDTRTEPPLALLRSETRAPGIGSSVWRSPRGSESGGFASRSRALPGDVNSDFVVDEKDRELLRQAMGKRLGEAGYKRRFDINSDRVIDAKDEQMINRNLGRSVRPPWKKRP